MFKRFWWVFIVMVPVGTLGGLLVAAFVTYLMPRMYESTATLEVWSHPSAQTLESDSIKPEASGESRITPRFFGTEFEVIKSRNALEKVVEKLELTNRWSVDKESAIRILKGIVDAQNIRGTDLISIRVRHTNKVDARDIAEEVAKAYKAYRGEVEGERSDAMLQELNKAVREQEDKVEERRKALATIVRTKGIIYRGSDSFFNESGVDEDQGAKNALQTFHQLEQEKMQLETQIASLLKYDGEQLIVYAAGIDHPENTVKNLHPQYMAEKRWVEGKKANGLSDDHPSVSAANDNIAAMKRQLDEGVVNLRATLNAQLDLVSDRLSRMTGRNRPQSINRGVAPQDYVTVKREFETDQELLKMMKIKQMGESIAAKIPNDSVMIHEEPVIADAPVSPNVTQNLTLGAAFGLLFSLLMALPAMWILNRLIPVKA